MSTNTKVNLNQSSVNYDLKDINQTRISQINGEGNCEKDNQDDSHKQFPDSELKFYKHQFDKQHIYDGSKEDFKRLFEGIPQPVTFIGTPELTKKLCKEADKDKYKDEPEDHENQLNGIKNLPEIKVELEGKTQTKNILYNQGKSTQDIIEFFRMQQYINRFNKTPDGKDKNTKIEETNVEGEQFKHVENKNGFQRRGTVYLDKVPDVKDDVKKAHDHITIVTLDKQEIKAKTNSLVGHDKLKKFGTFRECVQEQHQGVIKDLDFGKNKNGGQISDLIRWDGNNYLIQRVIDKFGNFWLQIAQIHSNNMHFTPDFEGMGAGSIQLSYNVGKPDFKEQAANPEGRIWIQYNQYIYYYTVENKWTWYGSNVECSVKICRWYYDLVSGEKKIDHEYAQEIKQEDIKGESFKDTKVQGARCVVFSTPMKAPELDDMGKLKNDPVDCIVDYKNDDKERETWLKSHYIIIQSACENTSQERWHTGRISQQDDILTLMEYVVVYKPRQSVSFNMCIWDKHDLTTNARNKMKIVGSGVKGILQVLYNDNGDGVPFDFLFAIKKQQGNNEKNHHETLQQIDIQLQFKDRLSKQAENVFDGEYQKVYTKYCEDGRNELTCEMMSDRSDPFKYRMAAKIQVLGEKDCMNQRNNIIMIYHKEYNMYQVIANQDGTTNFSSVISNPSESNLIVHEPFAYGNASFMQKLHYLYGEGFKQFHPKFINILISHEGKIVLINEEGQVVYDSIQVDPSHNDDLHKYQIRHKHDDDNVHGHGKRKGENSMIEKDDQRRFQAADDDRTVWVGLRYGGSNNQYVYLDVMQNEDLVRTKIGSFDFKGNKDRKNLTSFCPSSPVENNCSEHSNSFTQTYSLALMSPKKLYVEIMEYMLTWEEQAVATRQNTRLTQIGRKLLILNKPYSQDGYLGKKKPINFFPHYKSDYLIDGTNLFTNDKDKAFWNIFIPNFFKDDYQFDGELCSTGYKKFISDPKEKGEQQEVAILIDTRLSSGLIDSKEDVLTPCQRNLIFEQQIRSILNMWPRKDIIQSIQRYYTEDNIDALASLEVINCNSLADYLITQPNLLDKAMNPDTQTVVTLSFIEYFGRNHMNEEVMDGKGNDQKEVNKNYYDDLVASFPKELEWIRKPFCLTDDLLLSNPLKKCFETDIDSTVASIKILIENVFNSGRSSVSYNRLIQILPDIFEPQNNQFTFDEYGQFFSDYGEDGAEDNLTFAVKLQHEDLPKFSDKAAFMTQFELQVKGTGVNDVPPILYPNTDLREKAMEQIKELDKKTVEASHKYLPRMREWGFIPKYFENILDDHENQALKTSQDENTECVPSNEDEEQELVKSIPVDHFLINLNFLAASKLLNKYFEKKISIAKDGTINYYKLTEEGNLVTNNNIREEDKRVLILDQDAEIKTSVDINLKDGTGVSELQFVRMMKDINRKYKDGINEQQALQDVIDYTFEQKTEYFLQYKFGAYVMFFTLPYLLQLFGNLTWYYTLALCMICEAWKLFEFYYEWIQFSVEGFVEYIKDWMNMFDAVSFFSFQAYFIIRFFRTGTQFVGMNSQLDVDFWVVLNIFLNVVIVTNIIIQILQYLTVQEKMGLLVNLVWQCLIDIKEFMAFFMIWIVFFGLLSKALGSDNDLGAYPNIDIYTQIIIQTWQNSIGNINPPSTTYWNGHQQSKDAHVATAANIAVYTIYAFWFANQFLILIVLINFLIAVISQSYENVMDTAVIIKYNQRCDLNSQISIIHEHRKVLKKHYDCIILSSNTQHGGENEWSGFCQAVKRYVKEQNAKVFANIQKVQDQLAKTRENVIADIRGARQSTNTAVTEVENLLIDLKKQVKENPQAHIEIEQSILEQSHVETSQFGGQ